MSVIDPAYVRATEHIPLLSDWVFSDPRALDVQMFETEQQLSLREARRGLWRPVEPGATWGKAWSYAWFRLRVAIPREWKGQTVALRFRSGHGLAFRSGQPAQGLDDEHDFLILADPARGGEREEIFIESGACETFGKFFGPHPVRASLAIYNRSFQHTAFEMQALLDMAEKLPPEDPLRVQIVHSLDRALDAVERVLRFPKGPAIENVFADRVKLHGRTAVDPLIQTLATPAEIATAARKARAELAAVQKPASVPYLPTLHAVGHSHIDLLWQWPLEETIRKCGRTWSTALALMREFKDYQFLASQACEYALCQEHYPDLFARVRRAIRAGRWEAAVSMWVESDCMTNGGESLVRQFLWGIRWSERVLGAVTDVVWVPDSFGFCAQLPQIMRRCGLRYFASSKMWWNDTNKPPFASFWWQALDGSRILTHFMGGYCRVPSGGDLLEEPRRNIQSQQSDLTRDLLYVYGLGDGGGGPTRKMLHLITTALRHQQGLPPVQPSKASTFFHRLERHSARLPVWVGEHYNEFHRGTYTTQARTKRGNRHGEAALREAEIWSSFAAAATGFKIPRSRLQSAWRLLLKNQFHDVLPGSSIRRVYDVAHRDYEEIQREAGQVRLAAFKALAARIDTRGPGRPFIVFNPLSWIRSDAVELEWGGGPARHAVDGNGRPLLQQVIGTRSARRLLVWLESIPACGYTVVWMVPGRPPAHASELAVTPRSVRTPYHDVRLDKAGRFTRLFDRAARRESVPAGQTANRLLLFNDLPSTLSLDGWDLNAHYRNIARELDAAERVEVVEAGPVRAALRVQHRFGASTLEQFIRFHARSPRLDFVTRVDWHESHKLLKVAFPADLNNPRATYEVPFGHVERSVHTNTSWETARFEVPAMKWADLSEPGWGLSLLNDGKHGHDVFEGALRLSLLRAPKRPDTEADVGPQEFTYSLWLHAGDFRQGGTVRAAYELNQPLRAVSVGRHEGDLPPSESALAVEGEGVVVETLKPAEDGKGLIVRAYEAYGQRHAARIRFGFPAARAEETDLVERPLKNVPVKDQAIAFTIRPFEIRTFRLQAASQSQRAASKE